MTTKNTLSLDINALLVGDWPQCQTLLNGCFPFTGSDNRKPVAQQQLIHILKHQQIAPNTPLLDAVKNQLEAIETLSTDSFAVLTFVDQLFDNYLKNSKIHRHINIQIKQFRAAAAISLLNQKLPWLDDANPVKALHSILQHAVGWQPELGRGAERFLDKLSTHINQLAYTDSKEGFSTALQQLHAFFDTEQQRIQKLEKRLRDAEIGALHAKHANQLSARTLNQQMAGKKLPLSIVNFLHGPWRESMRLLIINEGKDSEHWRRMLSITSMLIWTFQPIEEGEQQQVYQSISELSEQLREVAIGLHHSGKLDEELLIIENEHLNVLKGQTLAYADFDLINNTDPLMTAQASISNTLLDRVAAINEGQWFLYQSDAEEKRIKLIVKTNQAQQLLFSNFMGIKSEQFNFEEFAYLLSSKIITPIDLRDPFKATGKKIITALLERHQIQQQQHTREKAIAEETARQQKQAQEQAREKALEEARAFAERQQQTRIKAEQQEQKRQQQLKQEKQIEDISKQLQRFRLGGRVVFHNENGDIQNCRLAVILQTTGEYIFVNSAGVKQHTLLKEQLSERLLQGSAKIIDHGSDFENTLEKVVNNLRKRK